MKKFLLLQACEFAKHDQDEDANDELYSISENESFFRYQVKQTNKLLSDKYEMKIENLIKEFERKYRQKDEHYNDIIDQRDTSISKLKASKEKLKRRKRKLKQNLRESQDEINQKDESIG